MVVITNQVMQRVLFFLFLIYSLCHLISLSKNCDGLLVIIEMAHGVCTM